MNTSVIAGLISAMLAGAGARAGPPRVVEVVPEHGEVGVDPSLGEVRVVFDQDMQPGRSICGGGPTFPRITGQARWANPRELVIPVALEPGHRYDFSINCPAFRNFRSLAGDPCDITPVSFTTAAPGAALASPLPLDAGVNEQAMETLRKAIDERYSYRDRVVKDWPGAFAPERAGLVGARTPGAFARSAARVLAAARDVHITLAVNHATFATFRPEPTLNVDAGRLRSVVPEFREAGPVVATGVLDGGLVYLRINAWPGDPEALAPAHEFLTKHADAPGVIIDVRSNGGGDEMTARRLAGRFARGRAVYSRSRTRDASREGGWTALTDRAVSSEDARDPRTGGDRPPCHAPVAVLIGQGCMSSNESFVLMMRHGAGALLVGERTFGTSGNPRPVDLGNGVMVRLPTWEDLLPDGVRLEGNGVAPDVEVAFTPGDRDPVLDAAAERLRRGRE